MTAQPIVSPQRLGDPCWTGESMATAIRVIAQLDPTKADWFLASHAPIRHLLDTKTSRHISEIDAFTVLSQSEDREVEVLVKGEPGTGKSHFVNWLKLRYDQETKTGALTGIIPVLIQRRTGSLKDALDQLVNQLPPQFSNYLDPIRAAIGRISSDEARERLAHFVSQELGIRWRESNRVPRNRRLRALDEVFSSTGFRQWLCREGGAISANVARLTSPSDVRERESVPQFSEAEFHILDARSRTENTPAVLELIDTFDDDPRWRQEAADCVNGVLRDGLRQMTGLGEGQLSAIFRRMRSDLLRMGKRLVLLIEDVSTLSVLDNEILNALEPQNDPNLCPLTSVVGMTFGAYGRLRDNEKQRAAYVWSLGAGSETHWRDDHAVLDQFSARYLNTVRLRPGDVHRLGQERLHGGDVTISACDECRIRKKCHDAFGSVGFGDHVVGMFPLRPGTTARLIENLDDSRDGVEKTPRGLLVNILSPLLGEVRRSNEGRQAAFALPIRLPQPAYWTSFENLYCSDWSPDDRRRLRTLAVFWTPARDADEAASQLGPLLSPFGMPALARSAARPQPVPIPGPSTPERSPVPPVPLPPANAAGEATIQALRDRLDIWINGGKLTAPAEVQEMLLALLRNGLPFEDFRSVARPAQRLIKDAGSIAIEDATTRSATSAFKFRFLRNEETKDLILALAQHRYLGNNSWACRDAEIHKRIVSTWLRRNGAAMLETLNEEGVDQRKPVSTSVRFLALGYMAATKRPLPLDVSEAIEVIFKTSVVNAPTALGEPLRMLYADLPQRITDVRGVLMGELDVPQGTGGTNFIDPTQLLGELPSMRRGEPPAPLGAEYLAGYSQVRYAKLASLVDGPWSRLAAAIAEERRVLGVELDSLYRTLSREGLDVDEIRYAVTEYVDMALQLRSVLTEIRQVVHCPRFDGIVPTLGIRRESICKQIAEAADIVSGDDLRSMIMFDMNEFAMAKEALLAISEFIAAVRSAINVGEPVLSFEEETRARGEATASLTEFIRVSEDE
jgi:hypothetical protein